MILTHPLDVIKMHSHQTKRKIAFLYEELTLWDKQFSFLDGQEPVNMSAIMDVVSQLLLDGCYRAHSFKQQHVSQL